MSTQNVTTILTLIGVLFGGVAVKVAERVVPSKDKEMDEAANIRRELREQRIELRDELKSVSKELDDWKDKYYRELIEWNEQRRALQQRNSELEAIVKEQGQQIDELKKQVNELRANRVSFG